jgi:uncharacterized protein
MTITPELPPIFLHGLELLNQGKYFEAHEAIEAAWRAEPGEIRQLYQGILQVAVVYHHIIRHNYYGARKVIRRAISNLTPFMDTVIFDIPEIINNLETIESRLLVIGSNKAEIINQALLLPVILRQ